MNDLNSISKRLAVQVSAVLLLLLASSFQTIVAQDDLSTIPARVYGLLQAQHFADAVALGKTAVSTADRTLPKTDTLRIQIIAALADALSQSGDYAGTVALLQNEIRSFEQDGIKTVGLAFLYQKMASPCGMLGRNIDAEAYAAHAVEILDSQLLPDDPAIAEALYTLAIQQKVMMRTVDELHSLKRALNILTIADSPASIQLLKLVLLAIADVYGTSGDTETASKYRNRAMSLSTSSLGSSALPDDYTKASEEGLAAVDRGDFTTARVFFERQLEISVLHFGDKSQPSQTSRQWLAFIYFRQHDRERARPLMSELVESVYQDYERYFGMMTEQERLQFTTSVDFKLGLFCSYVHEFHESDPELIGKMYDLAIWNKGAVLASTKSIEDKLRSSNNVELKHLREQLEVLRQQYRVSSPSTTPNVNQIRSQMNVVEGNIAQALGVPKSTPFSWRDVKARLDSDEATVEVLRFQSQQPGKPTLYSALVMRPQWVSPKYVFLGDSEEIEQKQLHRYALYATARLDPNPPNLDFWNRIEDALGPGIYRLYLSPDGMLNNVSFAIIPDSSGKLLADKYDLRYLSSVRNLKVKASNGVTSEKAILVGDPNFNLSNPAPQGSVHTGPVDVASSQLSSPGTWASLPETALQINSVRDILSRNKWTVELFVQDSATKSLILSHTIRPRLLHFATHGYFPEATDSSGQFVSSRTDIAMLKSGLVLAGANTPAVVAGDALLSSYEISSLDLSGTELVVLSACDTGLGDTLSGGEIFGLRRAFQIAGAHSVLLTMWNAPEHETTELIDLFYANWLAGSDVHAALRAAQATVRSETKQPYFWGAFVLIE